MKYIITSPLDMYVFKDIFFNFICLSFLLEKSNVFGCNDYFYSLEKTRLSLAFQRIYLWTEKKSLIMTWLLSGGRLPSGWSSVILPFLSLSYP